jgi:hypothetical protein
MKAMSMLLGYALMAAAMEQQMTRYTPDVVGAKPYKKAPLTAKQQSKRNKAKVAKKSRRK